MSKISVLMTIYNEAEFVEYAIRSCLPNVDHLVVVEGAYKETVKLGASERSIDGTLDIIKKFQNDPKVHLLYANEESDKDQRNVGLEYIKQLNHDGWLLIIDGDEVYTEDSLRMVKVAANNMERSKKMAAYFKSLTFVNDLDHYTEQEFPRLFRITNGAKFVNDNFMVWEDLKLGWQYPHVFKLPYIRYYHYSFVKGSERFELKRKWWESRFPDQQFSYGWHITENGNIDDPNHDIVEFSGQHPSIMMSHPKMKHTEKLLSKEPVWITTGHGTGYWKTE
jgi:glycosyltransferase involved in cell wall biosynthesis